MFKKTVNYFDKLEDRTRGRLSKFPIIYTFIGGVAIVLFWRAVWNTADMLQSQGGILGFIFYEPVNMIIVVIILLVSGLFVSYFIGDTILISGLKQQKKIYEKTEMEVKEEEATLGEIKIALKEIKKEVDEIKDTVEYDHTVDEGSGKN
ncbi:MAG: hypothetical protein AAB610_01465 [Patescibacteria group bacterium]